jgi:two-component system, sensor histidine kinase
MSTKCPANAPMRVLVVDDNVEGADAMGALLESMGCLTAVSYGGAQALATAARFEPHLALVDLEMPGMSGCEVARQLRSGGARSTAWLVCLTGRGHPDDERLCLAAGFDDLFIKPMMVETLRQLLAAARRDREVLAVR